MGDLFDDNDLSFLSQPVIEATADLIGEALDSGEKRVVHANAVARKALLLSLTQPQSRKDGAWLLDRIQAECVPLIMAILRERGYNVSDDGESVRSRRR